MSPSPNSTTNKLLLALNHAISGSAGTAISTCMTYPLSLIITRLQVQRLLAHEGKLSPEDEYAGIADAFSRICTADTGVAVWWKALYTGLVEDAAKSALDSFLFFLFYNWFRAKRRGSGGGRGQLGLFGELAVGMAAGACSRACTTPISNVVTRKQTAALVDAEADAKELSVREIVDEIRREKGIVGFWSGYSANFVLTLNPSITFFLQEFLKRSLLVSERWDEPGSIMTFLLAATSKSVASTITYPFQIAKARLQVGTPTESDSDSDDEGSSPKTERNVDKEVDAKLKAIRAVRNIAKQSILGTVAQIVRTEGVGALYNGIQGELLKGFFSHGTTMLAKDVVHKLLFKLYLVIVGLLNEIRTRRGQDTRALRIRVEGNSLFSTNFSILKSNNRSTQSGMRTILNLVQGARRLEKD